jgi:glucosamine 6-phosphate synthetase-like amidotransferase/phosphosugar isomerase protein
MCGLAGVILARRDRAPAARRRVWDRFTRLLVCAQSRGRDAAGVALVRDDGSFALEKMPLRASEFVRTDAYRMIGRRLDDSTVAVLGHARLATQGSADNPANNHPIHLASLPGIHGPVIGIHNGRVPNDRRLFLKYGYPREAQVDSEIIFRLVAEAFRWRHGPRRLLRGYLGELRGQSTIAWVMLDEPHLVRLLRRRQPLCHVDDAGDGAVYFGSLTRAMREVFGGTCDVAAYRENMVCTYDTRSGSTAMEPDPVEVPCADEELEQLEFDTLRRIAAASAFVRTLHREGALEGGARDLDGTLDFDALERIARDSDFVRSMEVLLGIERGPRG